MTPAETRRSVIRLKPFGLITPASANDFAVDSDVAPQAVSCFTITFLRIKGIGGKNAMISTSCQISMPVRAGVFPGRMIHNNNISQNPGFRKAAIKTYHSDFG